MAGIGDLIVKLKLNGTEFKKGLDKAGKDITSSFKNIKAGVMAVWSGIGAAAVSTLSNIAHLTQQMGDEWDRTVFKMKSTWSTFWRMDATGEYKNFFAKFKAAIQDAETLYNSRDAQFEAGIGSSMMRAMKQQDMNKLRIQMQDQTKTMEERNAAAKKYLEILKGITTVEEENAKINAKNEVAGWLSPTGKNGYSLDKVAEFVAYLGNSNFRNLALGDLSGTNGMEMERMLKTFQSMLTLADVMNLAAAWNANNDETSKKMTDAVKAYYASLGAFDAESYRIQNLLNSNTAKTGGVANPDAGKRRGANLVGFGAALPGLGEGALDMSGLKDGLAGMEDYLRRNQEAYDEWLAHYEEGIKRFQDLAADFAQTVSGTFSDSVQYMMDSLFGLESFDMKVLMAKMLEPLADLAMKEGELIMAEGIAMKASQTAFSVPEAGIAAGAALIAVAAAAKAGLSALSSSRGATTTTSTGSSGSSTENTINSELTVYVTGKISGSDIVISGNRTINKWNR